MYMLLFPAMNTFIYLVDNGEVHLFTVCHCLMLFDTIIYSIFTEVDERNTNREAKKPNAPE